MTAAAWEVLPLASSVEKQWVVFFLLGVLLIVVSIWGFVLKLK